MQKRNFNMIKINNNKDYKTPIKEILAGSSLEYLNSPFRSKRLVIKIIWTIFLVGFLFGSIYYVALNILDYLQYETTTSIYQLREKEFEFPTISFCSEIDSNFIFKILYYWFQNEDLIDDWHNHFESYMDTVYGQCFRFNSGRNMLNETVLMKAYGFICILIHHLIQIYL